MGDREALPNRRNSTTIKFKLRGVSWFATVGFYPDGRIGEVFISTAKEGTDLNVATRDSAIALSIALQHGASISTLNQAMSKNHKGEPEGPIGVLLAQLAPIEKEMQAAFAT